MNQGLQTKEERIRILFDKLKGIFESGTRYWPPEWKRDLISILNIWFENQI
jgi:hypothetical protein